jgi:hypothetical protein
LTWLLFSGLSSDIQTRSAFYILGTQCGIFSRMPSPPRDRPKPTTPEEEGIELRPDAWERFQQTVRKVMKARPLHRTAEATGADQPPRKRRGRGDKMNG